MKSVLCLAAALAAAAPFIHKANAAVLSSVPMQGTMVMPMVSYRASDGALTLRMSPTKVELTPLLVSNPNDGFSASHPWFEFLDPAAGGMTFSRRYGFVMDTASDPLPTGSAFEIRCLSMSPGLYSWRYKANPPTWDPIFGTFGSPEVFRWDGVMFHPAFAAAPGTNILNAVFDVALVDAASGERLTNASTGPFRLEFSNTPDGRPVLRLTGRELLWASAASPAYVLECCEDLAKGRWTAVTNGVQKLEGESRLILEMEGPCQFYRLRRAQ